MLSEEEKKAIEDIKLLSIGDFITWFNTDGIIKMGISAKTVLNLVAKLQKENEEKDKRIKLFEHECRKFKAFCKRVRKDGHDIDLFNQGQEQKCNQFLNLISGELHWDYEGKYFDETDKEIQKLAKEKRENNDNN